MKVYSHTQAVCPECGSKSAGRMVEERGRVYLERFCTKHGIRRSLLSNDSRWYEASLRYVKPSQSPLKRYREDFKGCPESCGSCGEHQQHTCLPVIEITDACDLNCPVCLKDLEPRKSFSLEEFKCVLDRLLEYEGRVDVINLSGGEPTLHKDLEAMICYAADRGVVQTTLSTHGLTLLKNRALREMVKRTRAIVALQFDGFEAKTWHFLRGKDFSAAKLELIDLLESEGISYSLVATVAAGVNEHEIPAITDFFFERKALSLMFQPVAFTGRAYSMDVEAHRITLPDVIRRIGEGRYAKSQDFNPLPCSHYSCFALAYYLNSGEGRFVGLKELLGAGNYLDMIANRTLPGLDREGYGRIRDRLYELWSAADSNSTSEQVLQRIRKVLKEMDGPGFTPRKALLMGMESMKAVFIHHFMDRHTFDFGRAVKCCNPYLRADGRLVPICVQNLFYPPAETGPAARF